MGRVAPLIRVTYSTLVFLLRDMRTTMCTGCPPFKLGSDPAWGCMAYTNLCDPRSHVATDPMADSTADWTKCHWPGTSSRKDVPVRRYANRFPSVSNCAMWSPWCVVTVTWIVATVTEQPTAVRVSKGTYQEQAVPSITIWPVRSAQGRKAKDGPAVSFRQPK